MIFSSDVDYQVINELMDAYPQLPNNELKDLAKQARAGDASAREKLILHNLRLVVSHVKPYTTPATFADGVQEGIEGLIRAVDKYDPELGYNFSTYALWWIKQALRIWIYRKNRMYVPRYMYDLMVKIKKHSYGNAPIEVVAARAEVSVSQVEDTFKHLRTGFISMDQQTRNIEGLSTLAEIIADEQSDDGYEQIANYDEHSQLAQEYLSILPEREQQILRWRFGIDCQEMPIAQISAKLGISKQRVQELHNRALKKIQQSCGVMEVAS